MDISTAYKQHQQIQLLQEDLAETEKEISFTDRAYNLAFVATFVLYFIFIWMMYVSDLWGFTTWLVENLSEFTALVVYGILATTLPLTMAMIKEIGYKHFAKYPNPKYVVFMVVGVLALAGVIYEAISSSSQQQHISTANAEKSKSFAAVSGTNITIGNAVDSSALATASQQLARCQANLGKPGYKHCDGDKAKVQALQSSQQAANAAAASASASAMEAKAKAMQGLKEDAYKPVFKAIRDSLGVSISTGVMLVTLFISVIFEVSHLLLILFRAQQRNRREALRHSIINLDASYMQSTGKAFDAGDFAEFSEGSISRPAAEPEKRHPFGFAPSTAQAASPTLFKYQQQKATPPKSSGFMGFRDTDGMKTDKLRQDENHPCNTRTNSGDPCITRTEPDYTEHLKRYTEANGALVGQSVGCPWCGERFTKKTYNHRFCCPAHKDEFWNAVKPERLEAKARKQRG